MLNKENTTGTREKEERKQFGQSGSKGEGGQFKPDAKSQKKGETGTKPRGKEDLEMEDEEECESHSTKSKPCH